MYKTIIITGALLFAQLGQAAIIPEHKNLQLRLGAGVDPVTDNVYEKCVSYNSEVFTDEDEYSQYTSESDVPPKSLEMSVEMITSYRDVDKYTNTQVSAGGSYAGFSGNVSYGEESRFSLESDRAMVGIEASAEYGKWYATDVELKPEFKKLYQENPQEFFRRCGKQFVAGYVKGQGIRILLATEKLSIYNYSKIVATAEASYGVEGLSADASVGFMQVASELSKLGSLSVEMNAWGTAPFKNLSPMVNSPSDVQTFRDNVSKLVDAMETSDRVVVKWVTEPYPGVGSTDNRLMVEHQRGTLHELINIFRRLSGARKRLSRFVTSWDQHIYPFCSNNQIERCERYVDKMDTRFENIGEAIKEVESLYNKCLDAQTTEDCQLPSIATINVDSLTEIKWPSRMRYELYEQQLLEMVQN